MPKSFVPLILKKLFVKAKKISNFIFLFMPKFDPIMFVEDDKLETPSIGIWGLQKYKLMGMYCNIFTTGMKNAWEQLVYIDLFAAAGYARVRDDGKILKTSSLIAASTPDKFTKYIICEENKDYISALESRFKKEFPQLDAEFISGDSNRNVDYIKSKIPNSGKALTFCFVDPFSLNLEFETIRRISMIGRVDFLILLALPLDGKRNFHNYIDDESEKIDRFIASKTWREPFRNGKIPQKDFMKYIAERYDENMSKLGYVVNPNLKYQVRSDNTNIPLYYLAFYSKNEKGNDFYSKIEKYQTTQLKLF
jgi:three-Cys-motif partner protein